MFDNPLIRLITFTLFAAIPIVIWLVTIFKKEESNKKVMLLVFGLGCLTAPALLGMQILWEKYPEFNLVNFIENKFETHTLIIIFTLLLFATLEEVIKLFIVKSVDKKTLLIKQINDAIKYSIASALGFSFTENIYYLYQYWDSLGRGEIIGLYIFRSIFTTAAHMIYSGIFGYYYGIGKFSIQINEQNAALTGRKDRIGTIIAKLFNLPLSEGFRQKLVFKGFLLALLMHFSINLLLEYELTIAVIILNISGYVFLQYLLNRKAGHLILATDASDKKQRNIAKKDEDVVIDLLALWFNDKRYVDVIHICERLLERDPDNEVVKLFKARAMDKMDQKDIYKSILGTVIKTKDDLNESEKNIISKYTAEKEMFQKVKLMIKERLKKEGKKYDTGTENNIAEQKVMEEKIRKDVLEKYTGEGTFKMN